MACNCLGKPPRPPRHSPQTMPEVQPPQIFAHHQRNVSKDIYTKLSDAIPPIVAGVACL